MSSFRSFTNAKAVSTILALVLLGSYGTASARFLGMDPKAFDEGNPQSFNRYAYGNNNPYKYVDPDGQDSVLVHQYVRWSQSGDLGHSMMSPYLIHGYAIHDLPGTGNAGMARLMPATGHLELTYEARQAGGRGNILGGESKVGEIFSTPAGANHAIGLSDVGSTVEDQFTTADGVGFTQIRIHAGGPGASQGCVTSPTCSYSDRRKFESDFTSGVGALSRENGKSQTIMRERTFIDVPSSR